jgi:cell wall assembly regulator SMI1
MKLIDEWQKFADYITSFGHSLEELGFRKGAKEEDIDRLEKTIELELPADYKQLLKLVNGQVLEDIDVKFWWLPDAIQFLSVDEVIESWKSWRQFDDDDESNYYDEYQDEDRIRLVIYNKKRIPVATNGGIDLFLDFIPAPKGAVGQLITNINECDYIVLANNFTELLENYNLLIKRNILKFKEKPKPHKGFQLYFEINHLEPIEMVKFFKGNDFWRDK